MKRQAFLLALLALLAACGPATSRPTATCSAGPTTPPAPTAATSGPRAVSPSSTTATPTSRPAATRRPTPSPSPLPTPLPPSVNVELVGRAGGRVRALIAQGNHVYAAMGAELAVLDISEPTVPRRVGSVTLSGQITDLAVADDYVYAAGEGLWVVDISVPSAPVEMGFAVVPADTWAVAVSGAYAYLACGRAGLHIVDVRDPSAPVEVGAVLTAGPARSVAVAGSHAFVGTDDRGLRILNIAHPAAPREIGYYKPPAELLSMPVAVSGSRAYVGVREGPYPYQGMLVILDISLPSKPVEVDRYDLDEDFYGITLAGDYLYLPGTSLHVMEVAGLRRVAKYRTIDITAVTGSGRYIYLADWEGLKVLDVSQVHMAAPLQVGFYDTLGSAWDVTVAGGYAYVPQGVHGPVGLTWGGLSIVDVSDPGSPNPVSFTNTAYIGLDVAVAEPYAYLVHGDCRFGQATCWGGLQVVDVSVPAAPCTVGDYDLGVPGVYWVAQGVEVAGSLAYVVGGPYGGRASDGFGLRVVDVSDPFSPTLVGLLQSGLEGWWSGWDIAVAGRYAYLTAGRAGLHVVDISNPAAPVEVAAYATLGLAHSLALAEGRAYVAVDEDGLWVFDVADPTVPVLLGSHDTPGYACDVAVEGGMAYVADGSAGLRVIDVSDPAHMHEVGYFRLAWGATAVSVVDGYVYLAGDGLTILRVYPP